MKQNEVCVHLWVKFCLNFPDIKEVIKWICEKTGKQWLESHLRGKFASCYDIAGTYGVMNMFYCDLDRDLQDALVSYALAVWAPQGMKTTFEENKTLLGL